MGNFCGHAEEPQKFDDITAAAAAIKAASSAAGNHETRPTADGLATAGGRTADSSASIAVTPQHGTLPAAGATRTLGAGDAAEGSPEDQSSVTATPYDTVEKQTKAVGEVVAAIWAQAPKSARMDSDHIMPHASTAYHTKEDMVMPCWALGGGDKGLPHDLLAAGAPAPPNEAARAETMRALKLCSATNPCPEIDVLLGVINRVMGVSTSVMDLFGGRAGGSAWVCNATVLPPGTVPWQYAACPWDLLVPHPTLMVVEDLAEDARFAHLPYIEGGLRTYVSSPIIASDGHRLGGLCLLDFKVKRLDIGQCRLMNNFAEIAVRELERYADVLPRLKAGEELLLAAYQSSLQPVQRNLASTFDSAIMIVDASKDFELLYVSHSWLQWSGGQDRLVAMGQLLPDLLETVTSVGLSWVQYASDAKAGARFVVPRVCAAGAPPSSPVFDISFRCGALEPLDNDTLPVAIPTFVKLSTDIGGIYIGRLHVLHDSAALRLPLETAGKVSNQAITAQQMAVNVIPGLKVGQVLARGGYGTAYVAEWHDTQVVCKVQDHMLHNEEQRTSAESEIALGQELVHPNVVRTLAHGTIQLQQRMPATGEDDPGVHAWLGQNLHSMPSNAMGVLNYVVDGVGEYDWMEDLEPGQTSSQGGRTHLHAIDMSGVHKSTGGMGEGSEYQEDASSPRSAGRQFDHPSPRVSSSSGSSVEATVTSPGRRDSAVGPSSMVRMDSKQYSSSSFPSGPGVTSNSGALPLSGMHYTACSADTTHMSTQSNKTYPLELRVFLVLEFCDKGVLQDAIDRGWLRKKLSCTAGPAPCHVLRTALDIAEAMKYLHSKKIIHGDLTGFNILLKSQSSDAKLRGLPEGSAPAQDQYGRCFTCKVADFGTSRRLPTAQEYIRTDSYATVTHMPPEMLKNNSMGLACDVWAFGVLLWSMWTGSRPWARLSHAQIMAVVIDNTETLHWPADTPPALAALGDKCLSYRAASRPPFRHVCRELRRLLDIAWALEQAACDS